MTQQAGYIELHTKEGLVRLQQAGPNIIRCVVTKEDQAAAPSMIICKEMKRLLEGGAGSRVDTLPATLTSGNLKVTADADGLLTWTDVHRNRCILKGAGHQLDAQDVIRYTTGGEAPVVERVKTVDGERNFIRNLKPEVTRQAWRGHIRFALEEEGVYGLGQGEDGIWNWRHQTQFLYQHNMRSPMPCLVTSRICGVLVDCGSLMTWQDDQAGSGFFLDTVGQIDYYVVTGSCMDEIIDGFRRLTGRAVLLPKWAYGYVQSKERYRSAGELADVVRHYRGLGIPLDVVVQDWYSWTLNHWGEKKLDPERYADMRERADEIHEMNAHTMVSVWPNMNSGTSDHDEFMAEGLLLNDLCTYDAFDEKGRAIYWRQAKEGLFDQGFDSWWCDSTEPFSGPDWNGAYRREPWERYSLVGGEHKHFLDPEQANLYALVHAQGMYEGQRQDAPGRRMLNLTRSGYAGGQRYGAVLWSGDIAATWEVMRRQIAEGLNMSLSGYPYWTLDAGAFFVVHENWQHRGCECHNDPSPKWFWQGDFEEGIEDPGYQELYVRWLQMACFLPMFRSHGTDTPREIWNFGSEGTPVYDAIAACIRLRYELMPYIYSLAGQVYLENGTMMRSLLFDFADDPRSADCCSEYMFGPSLLVCPVTAPMYYGPGGRPIEEGEKRWTCYLPAGTGWYDYRTHEHYEGGHKIRAEAPLERIPLFAREGAIIPATDEAIQYAMQPLEKRIRLQIFTGADGTFTLYEDDGEGYAYEQGAYTLTRFTWNEASRTLTVRHRRGESDWEEMDGAWVEERFKTIII